MQISSKNKLKANHNGNAEEGLREEGCKELMQISSKNKLKANHNLLNLNQFSPLVVKN